MAKKKKNRRRPGMKVPLLTIAGFIPGVTAMKRKYDDSSWDPNSRWNSVSIEASRIYLGLDPRVGVTPKWSGQYMMYGTIPILLGVMASKIASRMGVNRVFGRLPVKL